MSKSSARVFSATVLLLAFVFTGCGTGEYTARLNARVEELGKNTEFSGMQPPVQVPGTPVSVQLPKVFQAALPPEGTDQRRLGVPKVDIPGLKLTYEGTMLDGEQGRASFYCYLAVAAAAIDRGSIPDGLTPDMFEANRAHNPRSYLRNQLQINLVDPATKTRLSWQPIDCKNQLGELNTWDKVEVNVEQEFRYVDKEGQESYQQWDGRIVFLVRREGALYVIVGWRAPDYIKDHIELDKWASLVAGSVTVQRSSQQPP